MLFQIVIIACPKGHQPPYHRKGPTRCLRADLQTDNYPQKHAWCCSYQFQSVFLSLEPLLNREQRWKALTCKHYNEDDGMTQLQQFMVPRLHTNLQYSTEGLNWGVAFTTDGQFILLTVKRNWKFITIVFRRKNLTSIV